MVLQDFDSTGAPYATNLDAMCQIAQIAKHTSTVRRHRDTFTRLVAFIAGMWANKGEYALEDSRGKLGEKACRATGSWEPRLLTSTMRMKLVRNNEIRTAPATRKAGFLVLGLGLPPEWVSHGGSVEVLALEGKRERDGSWRGVSIWRIYEDE